MPLADYCAAAGTATPSGKNSTSRSFVKLLPEKDPKIENRMMELRARNNVDELLRVIARFITVTDADVSITFSSIVMFKRHCFCRPLFKN